jgi:predicted acyl esterase
MSTRPSDFPSDRLTGTSARPALSRRVRSGSFLSRPAIEGFWHLLLLVLLAIPSWSIAQDLEFRPPASATDPAVPNLMRDLAQRILPVYQENDPERYLSNLSALQAVAGDYVSANASRQSLQERRRNAPERRIAGRAPVYDIYVRARAIETQVRTPFARAYQQAFRDALNRIEDKDAYILEGWLSTPLPGVQEGLQRAFDQRRGKDRVSVNEAIDIVWAWFAFEAYRSFGSLVRPLLLAEAQRRYLQEEVEIKVSSNVTLQGTVIRSRLVSARLPVLLEISFDQELNHAREAAAYGYAGVTVGTRGAREKIEPPTPFVHDGDDARVVIEWVTRQPWSNGSVAMHGSGYSGYVAWSAAKKLPAALKAIATSDPVAPGVDLPMSGSIFLNSSYRWAHEVTRERDEKNSVPDSRWRELDEEWYRTGRRYREFPILLVRASAVFRGWLSHPSYDRYWQKFLPFRQEFAKIGIPVLTMTGYFSDGASGSLYYFSEHLRHNSRANHTLLVGPYDSVSTLRPPAQWLRGYRLDDVALIEPREIKYEWLEFALKGAKKPALLSDRVNYQLMEANEWRHAPSLDELEKEPLRLYFEPGAVGDRNRLRETRNEEIAFLPQTFDLADRDEVVWGPPPDISMRQLTPHEGEWFVSEPLKQATDVAGLFAGHLDFRINKMDVDVIVALYELKTNGEYVKLFDPVYAFRASYAQDRVTRRLLRQGVRQQLAFKSERMIGRRLQAGSRLVMALGINKRADQQINYGTGDDVSEESIDDAEVPLRIRWYNTSYIDIPR